MWNRAPGGVELSDPSPFGAAEALSLPDRPLAHAAVLPVLGIPVRFESDAAPVVAAVEEALRVWRALERRAELLSPAPRARPRVRLLLRGEAGEPGGALPLAARLVGRERILVASAGAAAWADVPGMEAVGHVAPALLEDPERFREVLDTLVLFLLTRLDRHPVHAAAVALGARGLLLAGPSGAGKSSLAYAAHRAGLRVLSDDAVYVQLDPRCRVWGLARPFHLVPEAAAHFPELINAPIVLRGNGKRKILVAAGGSGTPDDAPVLDQPGLCILERGRGAVAFERMSADAAVERLLGALEPGFDLFRETIEPVLRALAAGGAWRLRLSDEPAAAIACIVEILDAPPG